MKKILNLSEGSLFSEKARAGEHGVDRRYSAKFVSNMWTPICHNSKME